MGCNLKVSAAGSFLRWHSMDFCGVRCVNDVLKCYYADDQRCWNCDDRIKISNLFVHVEYIEAELRNFCSEKCSIECTDAVDMCVYCQKELSAEDVEEMIDEDGDFCSNKCEESYEQIVIGCIEATPREEVACTDCNQLRPVALNFHYNGKSLPFCSLACIFHAQNSCGIHAGKRNRHH